jgi:hypothetical protein
MNGVEILSSETIYNTMLPEWCCVVGLILMFVLFVSTFICLANDFNAGVGICLILTIGFMVFSGVGGMENKNNPHHIEYKVTIDDSVSMNEFLDKYEILDQEGKIYTVKEKE